MHPAWSVILFTTVTGAAQGLVLVLALATVLGLAPAPRQLSAALLGALAMLVFGLCASFLHLGRPLRPIGATFTLSITVRFFRNSNFRTDILHSLLLCKYS